MADDIFATSLFSYIFRFCLEGLPPPPSSNLHTQPCNLFQSPPTRRLALWQRTLTPASSEKMKSHHAKAQGSEGNDSCVCFATTVAPWRETASLFRRFFHTFCSSGWINARPKSHVPSVVVT
jgi:hypothetical protein